MILNDSVIAFRVKEPEAIKYDMVLQIYNIMDVIIMLHTHQAQSGPTVRLPVHRTVQTLQGLASATALSVHQSFQSSFSAQMVHNLHPKLKPSPALISLIVPVPMADTLPG